MTIDIVSFTPSEIILASDTRRYYPKKGVVEKTLSGEIQIDHANIKEYIDKIETDVPKIRELGESRALIYGGDGQFLDVIEGLNDHENISNQIMERLKRKEKITAYWSCHVAQLGKLTTIIYKNGEIETKEQTTENIWVSSFTPEVKDIFFKKYITAFYLGDTEEKVKSIQEFFKEITELFHGDVGGLPVIARISKDGFEWIVKPKVLPFVCFTGYSYNWCPEKIETTASSQLSWSQQTYTPVLELTFECESTMLLFINAFAAGFVHNDGASNGSLCLIEFMLTIDNNDVLQTPASLGCPLNQGSYFYSPYNTHSVAVIAKGSHTLRLLMLAVYAGTTAYCHNRRLTIIKGFYQGGTT